MTPRLFFPCFLFFLLLGCSSAHAAQDGAYDPYEGTAAHYKIAILTDGPLSSSRNLAATLRREIEQMAGDEFTVSFPKELTREANATPAGINRQLDALLTNPNTSVIIALGTIASTEALKRKNPQKPIIAPYVFDAKLQKAPRRDLSSGVRNLTYVDLGSSTDKLITTLGSIVSFNNLAILVDKNDLAGIDALTTLTRRLANEHTINVQAIPVGSSATEAIRAIPTETEAVMVAPLWQLNDQEIEILSDQLIQRQLPSFAMWNFAYVEKGIMATTMPKHTEEHLARKVAVTVQEILLGEDAAAIPVPFSKTQKLTFNMETARAIDVYPSLAQLTGATLLNEKRQDIQRRLNLQEAVQQALSANLDLVVAKQQVAAGSYVVGEAKSALLPQVGIGAAGRAIDDDRAAAGQGTIPEKAIIASATASQQIYSEKSWAGYSVEQSRQSGRESNRDTVQLDIMLEAANAYLNVLRQETIEQLQKENMALTQANLERAQIRLSTGVAGPDELYRWQTKFANDRQTVLRAESATMNAMQELNRTLHRPLLEEFVAEETDLSDPLLIIGDQLFYQLMHNPRYLKGFNAFALDQGITSSPELRILDTSIAAQERIIVRSQREMWLPEFTLEGNVDQLLSDSGEGQRSDTGSLDDTEWSVGVFARLPLFEGGRKHSTYRKNKELLKQLKTERQATEERVSLRILAVLNNTRSSYPAINLSREAADAAQRNLQLVTDSYVQGIKSIIDLLDAQNQALNADLDAANAVYNFLIDLMGVQRAIGNFIVFIPTNEQELWMQEAREYIQALQ